jgi:hypothetical protein
VVQRPELEVANARLAMAAAVVAATFYIEVHAVAQIDRNAILDRDAM